MIGGNGDKPVKYHKEEFCINGLEFTVWCISSITCNDVAAVSRLGRPDLDIISCAQGWCLRDRQGPPGAGLRSSIEAWASVHVLQFFRMHFCRVATIWFQFNLMGRLDLHDVMNLWDNHLLSGLESITDLQQGVSAKWLQSIWTRFLHTLPDFREAVEVCFDEWNQSKFSNIICKPMQPDPSEGTIPPIKPSVGDNLYVLHSLQELEKNKNIEN